MKLPGLDAVQGLSARPGWYRGSTARGAAAARLCSALDTICPPARCLSELEARPVCPPLCVYDPSDPWLDTRAAPKPPLSPGSAQWILCARGGGHSLQLWTSDGGSSWNAIDPGPLSGASLIEPPASAVFQGQFYLAFLQTRSADTRQLVVAATSDGITWSSCTLPDAPAAASFSTVALAVLGSQLVCAYVEAASLGVRLLASLGDQQFAFVGANPAVPRVLPCPLPNGAGLSAFGDGMALFVQDSSSLQLAYTTSDDGTSWSSPALVLDDQRRPLYVRGTPSAAALDGIVYVAANASVEDWRWELSLLAVSSDGACSRRELPPAVVGLSYPLVSAPVLAAGDGALYLGLAMNGTFRLFSTADQGTTWQDLSPVSAGHPIPLVTAPSLCWTRSS